ncbi:hypothetical protein A6280_13705 [Bacillus wiedmannii]|uniref:Uncharacterized protein n=1 Tax=Bacillus wiedmannii TaxID=1890302 RepID=A0A1A9PMQ2_9BACI|nr:hypothetical protein A6280_13705 [Bacillus wiedmannii]OUB80375.1 hypothetical protein BK788_29085 [Bacillus thuringiensis serovar sinensis]PEM56915.1 hypothetical protein CN611_09805 [Bacillus wiedmannii]PGB00240.1 hypothetical protein COL92_04325 [Bacillus wiedmannii]
MKIKCGEAITFIISLCNRLIAAGVNIEVVSHLFTMQVVGLDWIFLAIIGGFIGEGINVLGVKNQVQPAARENKKIG